MKKSATETCLSLKLTGLISERQNFICSSKHFSVTVLYNYIYSTSIFLRFSIFFRRYISIFFSIDILFHIHTSLHFYILFNFGHSSCGLRSNPIAAREDSGEFFFFTAPFCTRAQKVTRFAT